MVGKPPPAGHFPRQRAIYSIKRQKIRSSWHKINLYHISNQRNERFERLKYFAQKWKAKSMTRAYHGRQIREKQWQIMFRRRMPAVVPMSPKDLAIDDGSMWSLGRGSGLQEMPKYSKDDRGKEDTSMVDATGEVVQNNLELARTPFMQMLYAPMERRLDSAIHRALFASSIRQARQFVLHGSVKVNGKKMRYPGYLLNPGDMFQVEPDMVLYATGARKDNPIERRVARKFKGLAAGESGYRPVMLPTSPEKVEAEPSKVETEVSASEAPETAAAQEGPRVEQLAKSEETELSAAEESTSSDIEPEEVDADAEPTVSSRSNRSRLVHSFSTPFEAIIDLARSLFQQPRARILTPAQRVEYRKFHDNAQRILASSSRPREALRTIDGQFSELVSMIQTHAPEKLRFGPAKTAAGTEPAKGKYAGMQNEAKMSDIDQRAIRAVMATLKKNPVDDTKPYATPWRPRDYMSPFAFIPRFLEVNQKVCAAVYIRHPVARPGESEVPSPFNYDTHQLAFNWYVRKR